MQAQIRYLVQVECEPSPQQYAAEVVAELRRCFAVFDYHAQGPRLTVELRYGHAVADGAFKDLADLLIDALERRQLRLCSGVINRIEKNSLGSGAARLVKELCLRPVDAGDIGPALPASGSLVKAARHVVQTIGGPRLVPVMYFHRDVFLDLMLASKTRRIAMNPAAQPN